MKKQSTPLRLTWLSAVALPFAAGSAAAQDSSVTLYGLLDAGLYSKQLSGESRLQTLTSGMMSASRWGLRGAENLGGGWKARFDLSSYIRVDTGGAGRADPDPYWARFAWVGVENADVGLLRLGRLSTPNFLQTIRFNPFFDASIAPAMMHTYLPSGAQPMMTGQGVTDTMWANSVAYNTPASFGPFEGAVLVSAGEGTTAGRRIGASGAYMTDTLSVGVSVETMKNMSLNFSKPPASQLMNEERAAQFGISYDFKVVKLFGQYQQTKLESAAVDITLKTTLLGASVPVGAGKVLISAGHTAKEQTGIADLERDTVSVGYDYNLSKRTDVYAVVLSDKASNLARGTGAALGVRHNF